MMQLFRQPLPAAVLLGWTMFCVSANSAGAQAPDLPATVRTLPERPEMMPGAAEPAPEDGEAPEETPVLPGASVPPSPRPVQGKLIRPESDDEPAKTITPARAAADGKARREARACRARLNRLKVRYAQPEVPAGEHGCSLPFPVEVEAFGEVVVEPPLLVNCAVAERIARFLEDHVQPAASSSLGSRVSRLAQSSGYVCRPRNGTTRMSEHAYGNALDIMGFVLEDGRQMQVATMDGEAEAKFLAEIRRAACGRFTTVLGPGSDADHADHLHLDLAERSGDGSFCQ